MVQIHSPRPLKNLSLNYLRVCAVGLFCSTEFVAHVAQLRSDWIAGRNTASSTGQPCASTGRAGCASGRKPSLGLPLKTKLTVQDRKVF